jgi:hypothetical protein
VRRRSIGVVALLLALAAQGGAPAQGGEESARAAPVAAPVAVRIDEAIRRAVAYLVQTQKKDGAWGSPASTLSDIYAPFPGSQQGFQVAASSLALSGLLEALDCPQVAATAPEARRAVERATAWLLRRHAVRRITADTLYNTWAHAYALEAFARLLEREKDADARSRLHEEARRALELLKRFEFVEGGWGYYNFDFKGRSPGPGSTSFTTATGLIALDMARRQGVEVPRALVDRGVSLVRKCERPDGAFTYSYDSILWGTAGINKVKGSLARTPVCLEALARWGREVDPRRFTRALEDLEQHGHFLLIARKYPIPHETWYQNSGYFCFYGYYYAAMLLDRVPAARRATFATQIAERLLPLQETDGSFWDYQLFNYHKPYGTGYVLATLALCRRAIGDTTVATGE